MVNRIVFFVSSMQGGGAERVAALLCNSWVKQGVDVTLMVTFSGRGACHYYLDGRVKLIYLSDLVEKDRTPLVPVRVKRFILLRRFVREVNPDAVVSFLSHVNVVAILSTLFLPARVYVSERTYPPSRKWRFSLRVLRRLTYPIASGVVMQTQQGLSWLKAECPRARGYVIPNPVSYPVVGSGISVEPSEIVDKSRNIILGVGRLVESKGFSNLIEAFSRVYNGFPEWDVVILGEGEDRCRLEGVISRLKLQGRVYLPGRTGNLDSWYKRSDIFCMTSYYEGFPNALVEAMAYGLPVITVDCNTGPRDIVKNDVNGMLVGEVHSVDALSNSLCTLINSPRNRDYISRNAVLVRQEYSLDEVAKVWLETFESKL